jgi:hypothetical protein
LLIGGHAWQPSRNGGVANSIKTQTTRLARGFLIVVAAGNAEEGPELTDGIFSKAKIEVPQFFSVPSGSKKLIFGGRRSWLLQRLSVAAGILPAVAGWRPAARANPSAGKPGMELGPEKPRLAGNARIRIRFAHVSQGLFRRA